MLSKKAAAFGVEALLRPSKKRPIDFSDSPEHSEASGSEFSRYKILKTDHTPLETVQEDFLTQNSVSFMKQKTERVNEKGWHGNYNYLTHGRYDQRVANHVSNQDSFSKLELVLRSDHNYWSRQANYINYPPTEGEKTTPEGAAKEGRSQVFPVEHRPEEPSVSTSRILSYSGISAQLVNHDLWAQFHRHQTEMIITKNGRRMFPVLKIQLSGLDPEAQYILYLDMEVQDGKRYRYVYPNSRWSVSGNGEPLGHNHAFIHPDSPMSGKQWMDAPMISFDKLKLTNNRTTDSKGQLFFHSMQKYVPRIWIQKVESPKIVLKSESEDNTDQLESFIDRDKGVRFVFPETSFITVTAYQNQQITKLKINSNPFAKGFRENTIKQRDACERATSIIQSGLNSDAIHLLNTTSRLENSFQKFPSCNPAHTSTRTGRAHLQPPLLYLGSSTFSDTIFSLQAWRSLVAPSFLNTPIYPHNPLIPNPRNDSYRKYSNKFYPCNPQFFFNRIPTPEQSTSETLPPAILYPSFSQTISHPKGLSYSTATPIMENAYKPLHDTDLNNQLT